jgi:hypothetical protein
MVIEDTEFDTEFGPFRSAARSAGYRRVVTIRLRPEEGFDGPCSNAFCSGALSNRHPDRGVRMHSVLAGEHLSRLLDRATLESFALNMN